MGDAARAEARRRRILENSQKRLQIITGREEKVTYDKSPVSIPDVGDVILTSKDILDDGNTFTGNNLDIGKVSQLFPAYVPQDAEEMDLELENKANSQDIFVKISKSKIHVVLLAIFLNIFNFANIVINGYFFVPLLVIELTEFFFIEQTQCNTMLRTFFTLSQISDSKINWILRISDFLRKVTNDVCLFVFSYVICNQMLDFIFN